MTTVAPPLPNVSQPRLASIDAYRGLVMFLMMAEVLRLSGVARALTKAGQESQVWNFLAWHQSHVEWAGCSLHDLIQPSFSFLVGVALPFSIASRMAKGQSRGGMLFHAVLRAVVLVLIGVFLRSMGAKQTNWTFEDTLSQIGLGYVPLFLLGFTKQRWQFVALIAILVGYWAAFYFYPLPPEDFDYTTVGVPEDWKYHYTGLAAHWNKNSNLAIACDTWLQQWLPRSAAINRGGYATLSFIPTLGTMILGLIAGGWLKLQEPAWKRIGSFIAVGGLLIGLGLGAHESGLCPCVKRIWTPSWVLYSGGWCFLLLAFFYTTIDVTGWTSWSFPLRVIGANSIAAYLLADVTREFIVSSLNTHFGHALFSHLDAIYRPFWVGLAVLLIEWLILYWMYRQKIHIRI